MQAYTLGKCSLPAGQTRPTGSRPDTGLLHGYKPATGAYYHRAEKAQLHSIVCYTIAAFYRAAQSYLAYNSATKAREIQEGLK